MNCTIGDACSFLLRLIGNFLSFGLRNLNRGLLGLDSRCSRCLGLLLRSLIFELILNEPEITDIISHESYVKRCISIFISCVDKNLILF